MPNFRNPFSKTVIGDDEPLCNQNDMLSALLMEARSGNNNVLLAPRRSGKTSLATRLARDYRAEGGIATIADLSAVPTVDAAASRIATALFASLSIDRKIFDKLSKLMKAFIPVITANPDGSYSVTAAPNGLVTSGLDNLVSVASSLNDVSKALKKPLLVILDEFQDLTFLKDSNEIEWALRSTIQHHKVSYLFVGSRRKLLRDMFETESRAFYRGATARELEPIEPGEFAVHLVTLTKTCGVRWSREIADQIIQAGEAHTYSVNTIAHALFEATVPDFPNHADLTHAIEVAVNREASFYMSIYSSLPAQARLLLEAIAAEPTQHPLANDYLKRHRLSGAGTVRKSLGLLIEADHITADQDRRTVLTDPLMKRWLNARRGAPWLNASLPQIGGSRRKY